MFLGYALVVFECFRRIQNVFLELCTCALELRQGVTQFRVPMGGEAGAFHVPLKLQRARMWFV